MRPWNEIITEARDRNKEQTEKERRLRIAKSNLKGSAALRKAQGKRNRLSPEELKLKDRDTTVREINAQTRKKQEKRKKEHSAWVIGQSQKNAEERKKKQLEDIKNKPRQAASAALSDIKTQSISHRDSDATAYTKAIGNVASLAGGVVKAGIHYAVAKHKAKKAAAEAEKSDGASKTPENKPKKNIPLSVKPKASASSSGMRTPNPYSHHYGAAPKPTKQISGTPERPKLSPVGPKRLPPSGGTTPSSGGGKSLGQQARENPKLKKKMIAQRNQIEEYSNWKEEFIIEVDDKDGKTKKKKIIDVMRGKNKIEINPNIKEERDEEGGMARNELATMERAVKSLRKKIKSPNQQLPAWVQSKISKAADHIDTVADYMSGETEPVSEGYDEGDETFRQHSRETFASQSPSERRSRTASVLKKMKELNANVEKPKKKKKKKTVAEECGCEDDGKKVLAMMVIKKAIDAKKKKNSQLNSGIIGENFQDEEVKTYYKPNKSKVLKASWAVRKQAAEDKKDIKEVAAWQRKEGKNPTGGLNKKGIASYRKEHPGSHLSLAVTTKPSKLDPDSKAAKRRKSFCARMGGMPGPMKDEKGRPTRKALSLRKWNC